jgi:hypothetical protein
MNKNGEEIAFKGRCPFIDEPFDHCYCSDMNSLSTTSVIFYCGGNFEECEIYKSMERKI